MCENGDLLTSRTTEVDHQQATAGLVKKLQAGLHTKTTLTCK